MNQTLPTIREKQQISAETLKRQVIPSAILAPSAHNTQPWRFRTSTNTLEVFVDWDRHLKVSDPDLRQLYVSIGCAITNVLVAAKYWGSDTTVKYFPQGEGKEKPVVKISFSAQEGTEHANHDSETGELFAAIEHRHTNRSDFDKEMLSEKEQKEVLDDTDTEVTQLVSDKEKINEIAKLSEEGTFSTLSRKDFKEELSHWVRNSWTQQHDGMPGYAMGIPAPLSLMAPIMVRVAPIHIQEAPKTKQQVATSSALAVFATKGDTITDWLHAGEELQRVWLNATAAGLAAMPVVASVEAGDKFRSRLGKISDTGLYPQSLLRIGHASNSKLRATPRRTLEECVS